MCIKLLKLSVSDIASCAHPSESVSLFTSHPRYNISFSKHIFLYIDILSVNLTLNYAFFNRVNSLNFIFSNKQIFNDAKYFVLPASCVDFIFQ